MNYEPSTMNLLNLIFPKFCVGCNRFGTYFCAKCIANISQKDLICPNCYKSAIGGTTHPLCKKRYGLDGLWSLGAYQDSLKKAIKKLKYRLVSDLTLDLVDLMVEYWAKNTPQFLDEIKKDKGVGWVVVPVPLHPKRQNYRGFNQSGSLGRMIAGKLGLEYSEVLQRIRHTKPQAELNSWERRKNTHNAFALSRSYKLEPSSYLLVDDIWTTGSTLKECCYVLKRVGAKKVWAITLAR